MKYTSHEKGVQLGKIILEYLRNFIKATYTHCWSTKVD
jgi:hypothetical protein